MNYNSERMKKIFAFFIVFTCAVQCASWGAVNVKSSGVKKAAPVATKQEEKLQSATSLVPTVIGLVGSVQALNKQQQQLSADCVPTSSEIQLVNDLVKEWAKTGATTASLARGSNATPCNTNCIDGFDQCMGPNKNNESGFDNYINDHTDKNDTCIETFSNSTNQNTIWEGFPKASMGIRKDVNGKNGKTISNVYNIFEMIPFGEEDYTKSEAAKIAQFKAKAERCSDTKINAQKAALYGNFVNQTLGNLGSASGAAGTSAVLDAVSSMGGSGNIQSMLPSLGSMATQLFDK